MLTHDGLPLGEVPWASVSYTRVVNNIGWFSGVVSSEFDLRLLDVDRLIEFWRQAEGGEDRLEMVGFLRYWEWSQNETGMESLRIGGPDQIDLLDRRIIAWPAGEPEADKTDHADDIIKVIARENMEVLAPLDEAGRPRRYPAGHFSVSDDEHAGPSIHRQFAWRECLAVIREIADASFTYGYPLYFDLISTGPAKFELRTSMNVLGMDRTASGLAPVIFSVERSNLSQPVLREDWTEEWNYIYGGGPGEGIARMIDPEKDTLRGYRSIWNRRERFQDAREETTMVGIACKANEKLQMCTPRLALAGDLVDAPLSRYGVDWHFGDMVTAQYRGQSLDGLIRTVTVAIDENGAETVRAKFDVQYRTG